MRSSMKDESNAGNSGTAMDTFKGICIVLLLIVAAGAGGYFYGTHQQFAPVETTTAAKSDAAGDQAVLTTGPNTSLKKKYWLLSSGDDHVGYSISVFVNGKLVDKFFSPDKQVDITNLVKPGENQITFEAKLLPSGMREHAGQSAYYLQVAVMSGATLKADKRDTNSLLNYKRNAAETTDFNENLSFVTLE